MSCVATALSIAGLSLAQGTYAQQSVLAAGGFTGLSITPTARLLPWGTMALSYDNEVVGGPAVGDAFGRYGTSGHNFVAGFGVLRFLEISGRLATNKTQTNCYTEDCGLRDLSMNFKAGLPMDSEGRWNIAAGATDFGGNVTVFRTMYGVVTYSPDKFDLSLGYARRGSGLTGSTRPLDGPFASAAYRPFDWMQTHIEYNDSKAWAGLQLFAPSDWLPKEWSAHLSANLRVHGQERTSKTWFGVGINIPLYKVPATRKVGGTVEFATGIKNSSSASNASLVELKEFTNIGLDASPPIEALTNQPDLISTAQVREQKLASVLTDDTLNAIGDELEKKGFEDIRVGRLPNGSVVAQVNNATYNVNTLDGLGVALGVIARNLYSHKIGYTLVLSQRQIPIIGISGKSDCLGDWVAMRPSQCEAGRMFTPGFENLDTLVNSASWLIEGKAPSWKSIRVSVQPILRSAIATEYGVFDYSFGIRATVQQPLWGGAYFEVAHDTPISNSLDYSPGQVYSASRIESRTERILFHQIFRIPLEKLFSEDLQALASTWGASALTAHVSAGRINSNYQGLYGEMRWEPFDGRHRFGLETGQFNRTTSYDYYLPSKAKSILASYRYAFEPTRTDFEVTAGQFLHGDQGAQLLMGQWFDDVLLNVYYRQTKFSYENAPRKFVGLELVIPLTPRKDMTPSHHIQLTGASRWSYAIETKVGGTNFVSANQGVFPGVSALDRTFNSDRAGVYYFEQNMARIRSAAAR